MFCTPLQPWGPLGCIGDPSVPPKLGLPGAKRAPKSCSPGGHGPGLLLPKGAEGWAGCGSPWGLDLLVVAIPL